MQLTQLDKLSPNSTISSNYHRIQPFLNILPSLSELPWKSPQNTRHSLINSSATSNLTTNANLCVFPILLSRAKTRHSSEFPFPLEPFQFSHFTAKKILPAASLFSLFSEVLRLATPWLDCRSGSTAQQQHQHDWGLLCRWNERQIAHRYCESHKSPPVIAVVSTS